MNDTKFTSIKYPGLFYKDTTSVKELSAPLLSLALARDSFVVKMPLLRESSINEGSAMPPQSQAF